MLGGVLFLAVLNGDSVAEISDEVINLSPDCALAFTRSISDFEGWYSSKNGDTYSVDFHRYFVNNFGPIECKMTESGIGVYFYPSKSGMRGGAVRYLINKENYSVIERVFDR